MTSVLTTEKAYAVIFGCCFSMFALHASAVCKNFGDHNGLLMHQPEPLMTLVR
jgi:hypothetical protein